MTLKDKLPDRLKCSPLLTMESDSDIETIAESIVNLSDSDGDFFKKTEKLLLMACLGYLRDWCEPYGCMESVSAWNYICNAINR